MPHLENLPCGKERRTPSLSLAHPTKVNPSFIPDHPLSNSSFNFSAQNWLKSRLDRARPFQDSLWEERLNGLAFEQRHQKLVTLKSGLKAIEFISCSYLGLELHPALQAGATQALHQYGVQFSSSRTRLSPALFEELEEALSTIFKAPTLTFSTVHMAHQGVLPLLASGVLPEFPAPQGVTILLSRMAHSSLHLQRSALNQFGTVLRIDETNLEALEDDLREIQASGRTPLYIGESVGSMGGLSPIREVSELLASYGGYGYIDDAHGTSLFGRQGEGYVLDVLGGTLPPHLILSGSLSKAFGATGAFVSVAHSSTLSFLRRYCPTYVFSGPPSIPGTGAALASARLHLNGEIFERQKFLQETISTFDEVFKSDSEKVINTGLPLPIRGIRIGDENKTLSIARRLREETGGAFATRSGILVTPALFPTVAESQSMLRICLSVLHTEEDIVLLKERLSQAGAL